MHRSKYHLLETCIQLFRYFRLLDVKLLFDDEAAGFQRVGDHGAEEEDIFDLAGKYDEKGQRDI